MLLVAGVGVALAALPRPPLLADGTITGPVLALLVLLPLALGEVATGLADAGALAARTRGGRAPAGGPDLPDRPPYSTLPNRPRRRADPRLVLDEVAAAWDDREVLSDLSLDLLGRVTGSA